jgi:hypothetical protein
MLRRLTIAVLVMAVVALSLWVARATRGSQTAANTPGPRVNLLRVPNGGIQPQAVKDSRGTVHVIYLSGEPAASDISYVRLAPGEREFSPPMRVNSEVGSAIATGTIRGPQIAVSSSGRLHVAWMGSNTATPKGPKDTAPMLYARLNEGRIGFEAQRNVMQFAAGLDGGGTVTADSQGRVFVAWHGDGATGGELHRRVWLARSNNEGKTFEREVPALEEDTGACGCCGMRGFVEQNDEVRFTYRAATENTHRDMFLLSSTDHGQTFSGQRLDRWELDTCPMSTTSMAQGTRGLLAAWETKGQVYFAELDTSGKFLAGPSAPSGGNGERKHPVLALNSHGQTILVWTEGTAFRKGGSLAWQVFDALGKPVGERGSAPGIPVFSLAAVVSDNTGGFTIIY